MVRLREGFRLVAGDADVVNFFEHILDAEGRENPVSVADRAIGEDRLALGQLLQDPRR